VYLHKVSGSSARMLFFHMKTLINGFFLILSFRLI